MTLNTAWRWVAAIVSLTGLAACRSADPSTSEIHGVVRDARTHVPLAGANVRIERDGAVLARVTTDANGAYSVPVLERASSGYTVVGEAAAHLEARYDAVAPDLDDSLGAIELPLASPSEEFVDERLRELSEAHTHRDDPDDADLRPVVRDYLRGLRTNLRGADLGPATPLDGCPSLGNPPPTIRIWRRYGTSSTSSCTGRVEVIPFESYIKGVLPHEWIASWHGESLRAGALAIRTYSWRWVRAGGKYSCADLDDTTASQRYDDSRLTVTNNAVDATRGQAVVRSGSLVSGEYSAENGNPTADGISDPLCAGHSRLGHGRGMCQWGSQRWALAGRTHQWIAQHYWPGSVIYSNPDRDNDGVPDCRDNCVSRANTNQADADRDGKGDVCDNCPRIANATQADRDHDGDGDACDNCPTVANATQVDTDSDHRGDACDNCDNNANTNQADLDMDGRGDVCDTDDDNDTIPDAMDNCPRAANMNQRDTNGDGMGDACDSDDDGDTIADAMDNCRTVPNRDQADRDSDGAGDACDDTDGDMVVDARDNCVTVANMDQVDLDGDHIGDACDPDGDGDGAMDTADNCPDAANADQADADMDGIGDVCDEDRDGDGVLDAEDNCPAVTNVDQDDADGDGIGDDCDPTPGTYNTNVDAGAPDPDARTMGDWDGGPERGTVRGGCAIAPASRSSRGAVPFGVVIAIVACASGIRRRRGRRRAIV